MVFSARPKCVWSGVEFSRTVARVWVNGAACLLYEQERYSTVDTRWWPNARQEEPEAAFHSDDRWHFLTLEICVCTLSHGGPTKRWWSRYSELVLNLFFGTLCDWRTISLAYGELWDWLGDEGRLSSANLVSKEWVIRKYDLVSLPWPINSLDDNATQSHYWILKNQPC